MSVRKEIGAVMRLADAMPGAKWKVVVLLLLAACSLVGQIPGALRVSPNGRHLQQADGNPFFYLADTGWELFHRLNREDAEHYLRDRAAKGFTVIQAVVLPIHGGLNDPNAYGEAPLRDNNPGTPNEAFFRHVDFILDKARALGLTVGFLPAWGRHWKQRGSAPALLNPSNAREYGQFLGQRYRDRPLIWILGGDANPATPEESATINELAAGLMKGDGGVHLRTFHPRGTGFSSDFVNAAPWLSFHMVQTSHAARDHDNGLYIEHDRQLKPARPTLDGEPRYEALNVGFYWKDHSRLVRFDDADVRQAAWWAILAGACGHTYGNNNVWQMWAPGQASQLWADIPWREALHHPGAFQMGLFRRLLESRQWHLLEPAQDWIADGPRHGGAKVRAAVASDRSFALVYSPHGAQFTIDTRRIGGRRFRASWFDPRYGSVNVLHETDARGFQTYAPPTQGRGQDWVLVLEEVKP
ncbi:MAG: DUF4038 domain-containing protein [Acidobacteria bacterium]|nr:DUF4038 domain-containing protein [Acidobacteriota bacterium]